MPVMEAIRSIDSLETLTAYLYDRSNLSRYYPLAMAAVETYPKIFVAFQRSSVYNSHGTSPFGLLFVW